MNLVKVQKLSLNPSCATTGVSVLYSFILRNPKGGRNEWDSIVVKPKNQESGSAMRSSNTESTISEHSQIEHSIQQPIWNGYGIDEFHRIGGGNGISQSTPSPFFFFTFLR
jgi:hypothetical protein